MFRSLRPSRRAFRCAPSRTETHRMSIIPSLLRFLSTFLRYKSTYSLTSRVTQHSLFAVFSHWPKYFYWWERNYLWLTCKANYIYQSFAIEKQAIHLRNLFSEMSSFLRKRWILAFIMYFWESTPGFLSFVITLLPSLWWPRFLLCCVLHLCVHTLGEGEFT